MEFYMRLWLQILIYAALGTSALAIAVTLLRTKRPLRSLAGSAVQGLCGLAAVNIAGIYTGISLGINTMVLSTCAIFGIPGIAGLLFLKMIMA